MDPRVTQQVYSLTQKVLFALQKARDFFVFFMNLPPEHYNEESKRVLDKAKGVSDFVGLFVSMAFSIAFYTLCFKRWESAKAFSFDRASFGLAGLVSWGISLYLWAQIGALIFYYYWRDVAYRRRMLFKVIAAIFALWGFVAVSHAAYVVVAGIASAAK